MDTRTKRESCTELIKSIVLAQHPADPHQVQRRKELIGSFHKVRVIGNLMIGLKRLKYDSSKMAIAGWGSQNYKQHWWIHQKQPGLIKAACGILSEKDNIQWPEHFAGLARCEICTGFELKHLKARSQRALQIEPGDDGQIDHALKALKKAKNDLELAKVSK